VYCGHCSSWMVTVKDGVIFNTDTADVASLAASSTSCTPPPGGAESYSPAFSSIIVDGNSGANLPPTIPKPAAYPSPHQRA